LALFGGAHDLGAKQADQHGHQGGQQQGPDRELPVQPDHVAEDHHQLQDRRGGVLDRLVDDLAHTVGVFGEAVGQVSGGEFFEHPEIEPLQPGKEPTPQFLADLQGWPGQEGVLAELGHLLEHEDRQGQADDLEHPVELPGTDGGDQLTGQPGQQGPAADKDEHANPTRDQRGAVGLQQRQQTPEAGR